MPTSYTVLGSESKIICDEDTAPDDIEITIDPTVLANRREPLPITKIGSAPYTTTITPSSGLILGAGSLVLSTQYEAVSLISDGTNIYLT